MSAMVGFNTNSTNFKNTSVFEGSDKSNDIGFTIRGVFDPGRPEHTVIDGGYQKLGKTKFDGTFEGTPDTGTIETEMFTLSVGYRHPFTDRFSAGGRIGAAATSIDEDEIFGGTPESRSASETVPFGGIMLKYAINALANS